MFIILCSIVINLAVKNTAMCNVVTYNKTGINNPQERKKYTIYYCAKDKKKKS